MKRFFLGCSLLLASACSSQAPQPPPPVNTTAMALTDLRGVGHAVVQAQPGQSREQQRLLAIRAARLAALRDLAEQIHGARVAGDSTLRGLTLDDDQLRVAVEGLIRGARTVRINPVGEDSYEVVLEISGPEVARALAASHAG